DEQRAPSDCGSEGIPVGPAPGAAFGGSGIGGGCGDARGAVADGAGRTVVGAGAREQARTIAATKRSTRRASPFAVDERATVFGAGGFRCFARAAMAGEARSAVGGRRARRAASALGIAGER